MLNAYNRLTIARKLKYMGVFISITSVGLSVIAILVYQYYTEKNILEHRTEAFSKILADNIAPAILFNDTETIVRTLETLKYQEDIRQVYVLDKQWNTIQVYSKKDIQSEDNATIQVLKSKQYIWKNGELFTVVKVLTDKEFLGSLVLVSSLDTYYARIIKSLLAIFSIVILAIFFTLKFTLKLRKSILEPIAQLNENTNMILKTHELSHYVEISTNDEVGELGKNFNHMLHTLNVMKGQLLKQKDSAEYKANHDGLTSLPNRRSFTERLEQVISQSKRYNKHFAVFFMDLDNFKKVNDSLGHDIGDEVLKLFAERIHKAIRAEDTLARMGGTNLL